MILDEAYHPCQQDGVPPPHPDLGWGTPLSKHGMGYPPSAGWCTPIQSWDEVPLTQFWDGVAPPASVDRLKILPSLILRMRAVLICIERTDVLRSVPEKKNLN